MAGPVFRILLLLIVLTGSAWANGERPRAGLGETCGGIAAIQCKDALWCDPEPGLCGAPDRAGICIDVPRACTREYVPVCGCDGKTYGNDCDRRSQSMAKDRNGECS